MRSLLAIALATALCAACGGSTPTGACADPLTIDDMEDNDRFICASPGRTGAWFVNDDGTSTNISPRGEFTPNAIPSGRGPSHTAAHMTGFDFIGWGAAIGFSLNGEGDAAQPYDASATGGVRFWMKSNVPVAVVFPIPETLATGTAAACVDDTRIWNCDNHFLFQITAPPAGEWKEYDVPYAAAAQRYDMIDGVLHAGSATWNPSRLVDVGFAVDAVQTFDVWIDDVRFYSCAAAECLPTCTDPDQPVACPATSAAAAGCRAAGTICARSLTAFMHGVWGTGPNDVWAVGYGGTILHWDGTAWSPVPSGTTESLAAPWGTGPDNVWITGTTGTILHWDGTAWSPSVSGATENVRGLWGSGPDDVWAVGNAGTILHWDGVTWSAFPGVTSYTLFRIWGSSANDIWAAGQSPITGAGIIVHWDGASWSPDPVAVPFPAAGVSGTGPDDVWVVGAPGILHWDGSRWTALPSPGDRGLLGVWANTPTDAWAVGSSGAIVHWNGSAWSPVPTATSENLIQVWGSGADDVWAVGTNGTILHWDGTAWSLVPVDVQ